MGRLPDGLRHVIARNIRACRAKKYPGRGGATQCALEFGVKPQQWSPWECGRRTPDKTRLREIADFFGVTVEDLQQSNHKSNSTPITLPNNSVLMQAISEFLRQITIGNITIQLDEQTIEEIASRVHRKCQNDKR